MKIFSKSKRASRGFTLIELVIVIAVIAVLAALLVPTILSQVERARSTRARGDSVGIAKSIARVRTDTGITNSVCLAGLTNLLQTTGTNLGPGCTTVNPLPLCGGNQSADKICWGGPYMTTISNDPWANAYSITVDSNTYMISVKSNGADGLANTSDDITYNQ
jgi:general secretion pathway protein G